MAIDMYAIFLSFLYYQVKIFVGIIKKAVLFQPSQSNTKHGQVKEEKIIRVVGNKIQNLLR